MLPGFVGRIHKRQYLCHPRRCSGSADPRRWGPRFFRRENHKSPKQGLPSVSDAWT